MSKMADVMIKFEETFIECVEDPNFWENGDLMDGDIRNHLMLSFPGMDQADVEHELNCLLDNNLPQIAIVYYC